MVGGGACPLVISRCATGKGCTRNIALQHRIQKWAEIWALSCCQHGFGEKRGVTVCFCNLRLQNVVEVLFRLASNGILYDDWRWTKRFKSTSSATSCTLHELLEISCCVSRVLGCLSLLRQRSKPVSDKDSFKIDSSNSINSDDLPSFKPSTSSLASISQVMNHLPAMKRIVALLALWAPRKIVLVWCLIRCSRLLDYWHARIGFHYWRC